MKKETMGMMISSKRKELAMTQLELDTDTAIRLLGIGLACGGISLLEKK